MGCYFLHKLWCLAKLGQPVCGRVMGQKWHGLDLKSGCIYPLPFLSGWCSIVWRTEILLYRKKYMWDWSTVEDRESDWNGTWFLLRPEWTATFWPDEKPVDSGWTELTRPYKCLPALKVLHRSLIDVLKFFFIFPFFPRPLRLQSDRLLLILPVKFLSGRLFVPIV